MIEAGLQAKVANDPTVSGLCGTRVYPVKLPDSPTLPAVTYQGISTNPDSTMDGPSGFVEVRLQFDCWGETYGDAKTLQDAVRLALDGYTGLLSDGTAVFNVMLDTASDLYEPDSRLYRASTDYKVQFSQ